MLVYCPKCEAANREGDELCSQCGHRLAAPSQPSTPLSDLQSTVSKVAGAGERYRTKQRLNLDRRLVYAGVLIVGLAVGFFAGREHVKYELRSAFETSVDEVTKALAGGIEPTIVPNESPPVRSRKPVSKPPTKPRSARTEGDEPKGASSASDPYKILVPHLTKREYDIGEYESHVWFDFAWDTSGLKKTTRAVKGALLLCDVFGETRLTFRMTLNDRIVPNRPFESKGNGFTYNQFMGNHTWAAVGKTEDMTVKFRVTSIIYADGTREDFE